MVKDSSRKRSSRTLVLGCLERVSSKIFSDFPKQLTDLVGKQHGVYALYKGSRLYYVGLATNLRRRIKQHLTDQHAGKWDKFSLYLVRKADDIKELETLVMRVANPAGNPTRGRFPKAGDLKSELQSEIRKEQKRRLQGILGSGETRRKTRKPKREVVKKAGKRSPALAPYINKSFRIRGNYKDRTYFAAVNKGGTIRFEGSLYNSPSTAGIAARKLITNGWTFWRFKNKKGEWVKLDELRR